MAGGKHGKLEFRIFGSVASDPISGPLDLAGGCVGSDMSEGLDEYPLQEEVSTQRSIIYIYIYLIF
jgi:hypothetical protein